jgi:aminoglycoside phosphotransferase (APT) family kinase protein
VEQALRDFVEAESGGRVTRAERAATGASRVTWLVDVARGGGRERALVLRHDSGDGPLSGTPLDLPREAAVYRALRGAPVRVPQLVAAAPDGRTLLLERAPGSAELAAVADPARRAAIARDALVALAELHRLDPARLELPGFARPAEGAEHARLDLALWRAIHAARGGPGDPLLEHAFDWLDAAAPAEPVRTALCHGDAGPGNFLFEGERVTALLDFEFAHLGDPQDDLAWVSVRAHLLGGFAALPEGLAAWSEATGRALDPERLAYYRALVLLRMAVACRAALSFRGPRALDTALHATLLPYLRFLLPQALEQAGCGEGFLRPLGEEARAGVAAHPLLRAHARPLAPLELP